MFNFGIQNVDISMIECLRKYCTRRTELVTLKLFPYEKAQYD